MIGFIAQSAPGLRSHFSDVWKNNLLFASPSIRRPTVEQGTHEQLLTQNGLYAKLWNLQTSTEGWKIN